MIWKVCPSWLYPLCDLLILSFLMHSDTGSFWEWLCFQSQLPQCQCSDGVHMTLKSALKSAILCPNTILLVISDNPSALKILSWPYGKRETVILYDWFSDSSPLLFVGRKLKNDPNTFVERVKTFRSVFLGRIQKNATLWHIYIL